MKFTLQLTLKITLHIRTQLEKIKYIPMKVISAYAVLMHDFQYLYTEDQLYWSCILPVI